MSDHPKAPPRWQNGYGMHYHTAETHQINAGDFRLRMHAYGLPTVERKPLSEPKWLTLKEAIGWEPLLSDEQELRTRAMRQVVEFMARRPLDTTTDGPF